MSMLISNAANADDLQCTTNLEGWKVLTENKIFFGHQSVGGNIIEGLELLAEKCGQEIKVRKSREAAQLDSPMFMHSRIGQNRHPETKIKDFNDLINKGIGDKSDIAFMKLCYIDIEQNTDVEKLFAQYRETMSQLSEQYPQTKFLAVTAPLTSLKTGLKSWVKNALNGQISGVQGTQENRKRHEFNELLRSQYGADNKLFDLAEIESTLPDGSRAQYQLDDKQYYSLYQGYTFDGGHLNEQGQLRVAQALVQFLGKL